MQVIEYKDVSFSYSSEKIFDKINVSIQNGEYVLVIGPNGAGKSTFIKCMLGLVTPTSGTIYLNGVSLKQFKEWDKISYVAQRATHLQVSLPLSVLEVVSMGVTEKVSKEAIIEKLKLVEMENFLLEDIHKLSGGQQQRVFIARALMSEPEIIILDEPTVGLDAQTVRNFYDLITRLHQMGKTIIMVTHDMHLLSAEATRVLAINKKIEFDGTLTDYHDWHEKLCLYCGTPHKHTKHQNQEVSPS